MSIAELRDEVLQLAEIGKEAWPSAAASLGERLEEELCDPTALVEIAQGLATVAEQTACTRVMGASPLGERLAASTVAVANNGLKGVASTEDELVGAVLVVDGFMATGWQVRQAARRAVDLGADRVAAAVVLSTTEASRLRPIETLQVLAELKSAQ